MQRLPTHSDVLISLSATNEWTHTMSDNKNKLRQRIKQQHNAHLQAVRARWMKKLSHEQEDVLTDKNTYR